MVVDANALHESKLPKTFHHEVPREAEDSTLAVR